MKLLVTSEISDIASVINVFSILNVLLLLFLLNIPMVRADKKIDIAIEIPSGVSNFQRSASDPDISDLSVISHDPTAVFGTDMSFSFSVYRGKTLKRTLYSYIIDSHGKKVSYTEKFSLPDRWTSYNFSDTLTIKSSCNSEPPYHLVIEGLDLEERSQVSLSCPGESQDSLPEEDAPQDPSPSDEKFSFDIIEVPKTVRSGEPFDIRILVKNPSGDFFDIGAWSYIYRSSRCYSGGGDREFNRKTINIPEFANITFDLENKVIAPAGNYSLKLKIKLPGLKLPKELTRTIMILSSEDVGDPDKVLDKKLDDPKSDKENKKESDKDARKDSLPFHKKKEILKSQKIFSGNRTDASTVYLSSSAKARRLLPVFMIVGLALLLVGLIIRNF